VAAALVLLALAVVLAAAIAGSLWRARRDGRRVREDAAV
jgi:hypothetical protein